MAWVAEDLFNSYSDGDLNGNNGGTGWSGAWSADTSLDVQGTTTFEGAKAVSWGAFAGTGISMRDLTTAVTAGTVYFSVRAAQTNQETDFILRQGATGRMFIKLASDGNIKIFNNGVGYETIQAYSANTWYRIGVDFDNVGQPNLYRANVDNGSFTAYKTVNGGSYTNISRFQIDNSAVTGGTTYIDSISPTYSLAVGPANLKSYNTNVAANIKSINTNLIANVKALNTNT